MITVREGDHEQEFNTLAEALAYMLDDHNRRGNNG